MKANTYFLPHTVTGMDFLATHRYALLADEMRVGKTFMSIFAADKLKAKNILVICPAYAKINWRRQFSDKQFLKREVQSVSTRIDWNIGPGVSVLSYSVAHREEALVGLYTNPPDILILDESHHLKNPEAIRTKAILGKKGLIHKAKRVWFLSGTPCPNDPSELWAILYTCFKMTLTEEQFINRYCHTKETPYGPKIIGGKNLSELKAFMAPFILRRLFAEVFPDIPPIFNSTFALDLSHGISELVTRRDKKFMTAVNKRFAEVHTDDQLLALMEFLKNTQGPEIRRIIGLSKVPPLVRMLTDELENEPHKVVLFAYHRDVISALVTALSIFNPLEITGATTLKKRDERIREFTQNPQRLILVGQIKAAGEAIDLSIADESIIVEPSWVPADNVQAAARCMNLNKKQQVSCRFAYMPNQLDQRIQQVLCMKSEMLSQLFEE